MPQDLSNRDIMALAFIGILQYDLRTSWPKQFYFFSRFRAHQFCLTTLYPRREKHLGRAGIEPLPASSASDHSNHYAMAPSAISYGSFSKSPLNNKWNKTSEQKCSRFFAIGLTSHRRSRWFTSGGRKIESMVISEVDLRSWEVNYDGKHLSERHLILSSADKLPFPVFSYQRYSQGELSWWTNLYFNMDLFDPWWERGMKTLLAYFWYIKVSK